MTKDAEFIVRAVNEYDELKRKAEAHDAMLNALKAAVARLKEFGGVKVKYRVDLTSDLEAIITQAESHTTHQGKKGDTMKKSEIHVGDKVTVKSAVESYESREVSPAILPQFVGTALRPGDVAEVCRVDVPYVRGRGSFVFVRWVNADGLSLRTGIGYDNIRKVKP